jgi:NADH-quinone oxidoreductase subunit L
MQKLYLLVPLAPLAGALLSGLLCRKIGNRLAHSVTILCMIVSAIGAGLVFMDVREGHTFNGPLYTWLESESTRFEVGFLIDQLSATMMLVVTFVSLMVHVYTIGYMHGDPGYNRFFSYISLFTFSMLMLVMSNNFLQLFFGWEAVGLVSYLLIGFWYTRPTAIYANLKAFLVNRVGDFGFLLGIALVLMYFGTLDYAEVFAKAGTLAGNTIEIFPGHAWSLLTVTCILLFVGAMGKSAQFPLHVWLPDSMEGPTPISALIHAATMVTAGIFMVSRMSPLFELSQTALSFVLVIGAITTFFMALIAMTQFDIKRVVAYSTLSQLGYMTMALGASAYSAAMFHLVTHAFFKAVLFLGAGSVIIAMHHEQDMRKMGGLRKYLPVTYLTVLIGAWANAGLPPFAGFFSKDTIIEAVHAAQAAGVPGSTFALLCALGAVFAGGFYSFRLVFYAFHGKERFDVHGNGHGGHGHDEHGEKSGHGDDHGHGGVPHESPLVVTIPLILLAIPSVCAGWLIGTVVFGDYFGSSIFIAPEHGGMAKLAEEYHGVLPMIMHSLTTLPFALALAGAGTAFYLYIVNPALPGVLRGKLAFIVNVLDQKYYLDRFNDWFFAGGARGLGGGLWKFGDVAIIDGFFVNGSARVVGWFSTVIRQFQSGYIYHYAFAMIIGILLLLSLLLSGAV